MDGPLRQLRTTTVALVALLAAANGFPQEKTDWPALRSRADAAKSHGEYLEARRIAQDAFDRLEQELPRREGDLADARDLVVETAILAGDAADPATLALAEDALTIRRRLDRPDSLTVARAVHNLGDIHFQRGEFKKALALHESGLVIRRKSILPGDGLEADSLERIALVQMRVERYQAASTNLQRALAIRERPGVAPVVLAHTLELLGWLNRYAGNYELARQAIERSRSIGASEEPAVPEPISSVELRGDLLMLQGAIPLAYDTWSQGLRAATLRLGPGAPVIAALERRLALAAAAAGRRQDSLDHLANGMRVAETRLAPCDPERIGLMDYAASSSMYDGQFIEARAKYQVVLESCRMCLGEAHANTATVTSNLASLAVLMGEFPEAERLNRRAIAVWSSVKPDHPYVAQGLDALAEVLAIEGRLEGARGLYERALRIRRSINKDHPNVAWTLTNLARVTADAGNSTLALDYVDRAMDIYERAGPGDDPDHLPRALLLRGELLTRRGDFDVARKSLTDALSAREQFFGLTHPLTAEARAALARANWAAGDTAAALSQSLAAEDVGRDHVRSTVRYLPERRSLAYALSRPEGLSVALSIAAADGAHPASPVLESLIRSRSVVLDELGTRRSSITDPRIASSAAVLAAKRQRFANLMLRSMAGDTQSVTPLLLDRAARERDDAEQEFATENAKFRSELDRRAVGLEEVRQALPPHSVLISFVRYMRAAQGVPTGRKPATYGSDSTLSYIAFVLRPDDSDPAVLSLGPAVPIDAAVARWRQEMLDDAAGAGPSGRSGSPHGATGTLLRQRIWDPIAHYLGDAQRVFVVPDGALNLVPFAALPAGGGRYLLDDGPVIHYLSSERDLVAGAGDTPRFGAGLLAVGGPAFAVAPTRPPSRAGVASSASSSGPATTPFAGASSNCITFGSMQFDELPASRREAQTVASLWQQFGRLDNVNDGDSRVLLGANATEGAFKRLGPGRRILHIATHGFFLSDSCASAVKGTRSVGGLVQVGSSVAARPNVGTMPGRTTLPQNPLLLSGLAMAGANRHAASGPAEDDGILTAEEVAALNLDGVEWAVLSACDTGLGTVAAGEGVFGLRRAFQVAGVHTVIMSLWSVDDRATQQWMEALYRARLSQHLDTADSVRQASLTLLRERRAKRQNTNPFYWAGFVAAGDWR